MSDYQILAYNNLRILQATENIRASHGQISRHLLAAHIREIGNAIIEMSYSNRRFIVGFLESVELFESICATRHFLAHDEAAIPIARLKGFLEVVPSLTRLADHILQVEEIAQQIPFARSHLENIDDSIVEFDPEILGKMPYSNKSRDHIALCYAMMVKDIEWRKTNPVSCAIDFITRLDFVFRIDEDLTSCRNWPFNKIAKLKKNIIEHQGCNRDETLEFLEKGGINCLGNLKAVLKQEPYVMTLAKEFAGWIEQNHKSFLQAREAFCARWLEENGLLDASSDDTHMTLVSVKHLTLKGEA